MKTFISILALSALGIVGVQQLLANYGSCGSASATKTGASQCSASAACADKAECSDTAKAACTDKAECGDMAKADCANCECSNGKCDAKDSTKTKAMAKTGQWLTDFDEAKALAASLNRPILVNFSGSDWCGWCIKLDNEVFAKDEFQNYAKDELVLFLADFPRSSPQSAEIKDQNRALAEKYGVQGFPTVLLIDNKGEVLARTGYKRGGADKYVDHIRKELASL